MFKHTCDTKAFEVIKRYELNSHNLIKGGYYKEVARNPQFSIIFYLQLGTQPTLPRLYKKPALETVVWIEGDDVIIVDEDQHIVLNGKNPSYTIIHNSAEKIYNYYTAHRKYALTTVTFSPPFNPDNLVSLYC